MDDMSQFIANVKHFIANGYRVALCDDLYPQGEEAHTLKQGSSVKLWSYST
jgi:hypothetical protein